MADWIEKNLNRMMNDILTDTLRQRPKPYGIRMSKEAYKAFCGIMVSKAIPYNGIDVSFMGIPIRYSPNLPEGTFVVDRPAVPFQFLK